LIAGERGFCPVAKSGFIKCKIKEKAPKYTCAFVYDQKEYAKNRKEYLEQRCVNEGGIYYLRLFDRNHWHYGIYVEAVASLEGGYMILRFQENQTYGSADKEYYTVNVCNLTRSNIEKICLDFENCDSFDIYQEEIQEINVNFKKQLEWNSSCFGREIENGVIRLKLNEELTWRYVNVEYEYVAESGVITFSKVYDNRSRKKIAVFDIRSAEYIAPASESETLRRVTDYDPKYEYSFVTYMDDPDAYTALYVNEDKERVAVSFIAHPRLKKTLKFYNSAASKIRM
jgi:hypothetical protein